MKLESWTRYLVAAALVLLVGAAWVLAEEKTMSVEVRSRRRAGDDDRRQRRHRGHHLEDLADGEERTYDVGGHEVTVKRVDESLTLVHDGPMCGPPSWWRPAQKIWIGGDEEGSGWHVA